MALQFSSVSVPLDGGLDEKTSDIIKQPPSADELINVVFDKNGEVRCRPGIEDLGGSQWSGTRFVAAGAGYMLGFDASNARPFREPVTWNNHIGSNYNINVDYAKKDIARNASSLNAQSEKIASVRGLDHTLCVVPTTVVGGSFLKAVAYRNDTGRIDFTTTIAAGVENYHVAVSQNGTQFCVAHITAAGAFIATRIYVPTSLSSSTTHSTASVTSASPVSSCCGIGGSDLCAIASAGTTVYWFKMSDAGAVTQGSVATTFGSGTVDLIDIATYDESGPSSVDGYVLIAGRSASGNYEWHELNTSLSVLSSYTGAGLASASDKQVTIAQQYNESDNGDYFIAHCDTNDVVTIIDANETGPGTGTPRQIPASHIGSKMFKHPSIDRTLLAITPYKNNLADEGTKLCVIERYSGLSTNGYGATPVCSFAMYNGAEVFDEWVTQANVYDGIASIGSGKSLFGINSAERHTFDFAPSFLPKTVYGSTLYFGGGDVRCYDGKRTRVQYHNNTPYLDATITKVGAAAGSYSTRVVAVYKNNQGRICRSAPSNTVTGTLGATSNSYTVDFTPLNYANTDVPSNDVDFEIYRTDDGGSIFYLSDRFTQWNYDFTVPGRYRLFETSPGTLAGNKTLFAQSELASSPPPCPSDLASFDGRMWLVPAENRREVWFSNYPNTDEEPRWSSSFRINLGAGDDIVRMASIDDKLLLFTATGAYVVYGQGPNNAGVGPSYQFQDLPLPMGCSNPASVVTGPFGVMFQANSGIWLIDRSLNPSFIGSKVEGLEGSITSAALNEQRHEVIFGQTTGAIVYNYLFNKWSSFDEVEINDLCVFDGELVFVDADPTPNAIDIGRFTASATTAGNYAKPTLTYTTPWIALAGIQGVKRVRRIQLLFDHLNTGYAGDITITSYYDYDLSASDSETYTAAGWAASYPRQIEYELPTQDVESFRIKIELEPSATHNPGVGITQMRVLVAQKRGLYNRHAGARA